MNESVETCGRSDDKSEFVEEGETRHDQTTQDQADERGTGQRREGRDCGWVQSQECAAYCGALVADSEDSRSDWSIHARKESNRHMRTKEQVDRLVEAYVSGGTKTEAMIAGGYSPKCAQSNTNKVLPETNQRHVRFAWGLFLFNWDKTKAAIFAGYRPKWAGTNTARLTRHPEVQAEILRVRQRLFPQDYPS